MQPTLQISTAEEYALAPNSSSGGLYHLVITWQVIFMPGSATSLARPKSATLRMPLSFIRRLLGLRSYAGLRNAYKKR